MFSIISSSHYLPPALTKHCNLEQQFDSPEQNFNIFVKLRSVLTDKAKGEYSPLINVSRTSSSMAFIASRVANINHQKY